MKRVLVASILGLAAAVSTYGQANIIFDTYAVSTEPYADYRVLYANGLADVQAADGYVANLLWSYTINSVTFTGDAGLQIALNDRPGYGSGWIQDPEPLSTAASYSVEATPITFTIQVWKQSEGTYGSALDRGSVSWLDTQGFVPGNPSESFHGFIGPILIVPEPTTLALVGLGAAALLALRRR